MPAQPKSLNPDEVAGLMREEQRRFAQHIAVIQKAVPEAFLLFILRPSVESLFQRLTGRGTEKEETLRRWLNTALQELNAAEAFDFFLINEDLKEVVQEVRAGIESLLRQDRLLQGT
jgi:guanylate kinase